MPLQLPDELFIFKVVGNNVVCLRQGHQGIDAVPPHLGTVYEDEHLSGGLGHLALHLSNQNVVRPKSLLQLDTVHPNECFVHRGLRKGLNGVGADNTPAALA